MLKKIQLYLQLHIFSIALFAQTGTIRGTVFDAATGEYLPGVTVFVEKSATGTITDLDGKFNLNIAAGTYDLRISYISYESSLLKGIQVKQGNVTVLDDIGLKEATIEITGVTVTGERIRNTENALMAMKMKSANLIDGISAGNLRKIGDSDAASSVKRVSGVSVSNGKYVYVRGLGDRYSKTILNGVTIPGLDPDRNTVQMDIFPSNIIDNILVYKTFSAELPADFSGGIIDLSLKDFPEKKTVSFYLNSSYNQGTHFIDHFLTYDGGSTDYLGIDDGTRKIPAKQDVPFYSEAQSELVARNRYVDILKGFDPNMAAYRTNNNIDYGFGLSLGNQIPRRSYTIGYNLALSYKYATEYYEDALYQSCHKSPDNSVNELGIAKKTIGDYGSQNTLISGMGGVAIKTNRSKVRLYLLHLQNGDKNAGIFDYYSDDNGTVFNAYQHILDFRERAFTNILLDGKHQFADNKWEINWKLSPGLSTQSDPDIRLTRYKINELGEYVLGTDAGLPERVWRELEEVNASSQLNVIRSFNLAKRPGKLMVGAVYNYKDRSYSIRKYSFKTQDRELVGDPNEIFLPEYLWNGTQEDKTGTQYEADFVPYDRNKYQSDIANYGGYISMEYSILSNLRSIVGLRFENYQQHYSGTNQTGTFMLDNQKVLDLSNLFPSINMVYSITQSQNLRFIYGKTKVHPSFKELSYSEIYDPISNRTFIGGLFPEERTENGEKVVYWDGNLTSTDIHNFDLRWEYFAENGQTVSFSGFYKKFLNPIEVVQSTVQSGSYQPRNVGDGELYGVEGELRFDFTNLTEVLRGFTLISNITYIESKILRSTTEYNSLVKNTRIGETVDRYREMAGQSPYLINLGLSFNGRDKGFTSGFEAGVYYNVQGPTLALVGISDLPDVYSQPFHSLNLNINKKFGESQRFQAGLKIDNILNKDKEIVFSSFGNVEEYYEKLSPGTTFTLRLSYAFF